MKLIILISILLSTVLANDQDDKFVESVKNSRDFTGKVVLVTGSSSGIGKQTTKLFSALGAQVVVTGRKAADVSAAATEIQAISPKKLKPLEIVADLTNTTDIDNLVDETVKHFGRLDILVNNAGILGMATIESDTFIKTLDENFDIDVRAALRLVQKSTSALSKANGTIINISSSLTLVPQAAFLPYEISKQSLEMSTKILAIELGPKGIRVNAIRVGIIDSHTEPIKVIEAANKLTPLGRIGHTDDIAKGVVLLASTDAQFITGAVLDIDGGMALGAAGNLVKDVLTSS